MKRITSLVALAALALSACGSDDGVEVEGAWARSSAAGTMQSAVYFDLTVPDDDRLVGASVPSDVSAAAEIHEVLEADSGGDVGSPEVSEEPDDVDDMDDMAMSEGSHDMSDMDDTSDMGATDGMMVMREMADGLALTGGETVTFEPGGYHVMLPELVEPLEDGDEFDLTLVFDDADSVTVSVTVSDEAP